ncbi:MAG: hypothetical protein PF690_18525 [Deltaproteobacteria bacterium]|jgi:hypothetical protein|nr:hypothetical protein [Deltaproteobacteria bacterium]
MNIKRNGIKNLDSRSKCGFRTSIEKNPITPCRIRKITGSFAFIEHRFLREGFWASLDHHQLLLYLFLIIVSDRHGLSYYSYDKICTLLRVCVDEYILARNALIDKDLIAFDGSLFQVLSLPEKTVFPSPAPLQNQKDMELHDPATVHHLVVQSFGKNYDRN